MITLKSNDPLASLISSDTKEVDRKKLANLLQPFMKIDSNSKEFSFLDPFREIDGNMEKIEIVLLASKARSLFFEISDGLSPSEIISLDIMPAGSVKSSLRKLSGNSKIKKDRAGKYCIPSYRIPDLVKQFVKN